MKDSRVKFFAERMDVLSRRDRIFINNPAIMQGLGLVLLIMPATTMQNAVLIATAIALLLTPTRVIAALISRKLPYVARAIVYTMTAAIIFVPIMFFLVYFFGLSPVKNIGIYLPLLVFEPLIIKRYANDAKERITTSFKKGAITTVGFCLVLFVIAAIREVLGRGTIFGSVVFSVAPVPIVGMAAGGLIIVGLVAGIWRALVYEFKKRVNMGVKAIDD